VKPIALLDLAAQRDRLAGAIESAMATVVEHGQFIGGPEIVELESRLGGRAGGVQVVACSSGTDALLLPLLASGIGPGDAVVIPSFTFPATAEVVALVGATPVFADVDRDTFNVTAETVAAAIEVATKARLRPRAVVPVDLFGQPAPRDAIEVLARSVDALVIVDAAQSLGAQCEGKPAEAFGAFAATSFFPAKPLGCYGDGGAVFTAEVASAELLRSLRAHGKGTAKYDIVRVGINGRLDTLQAAVLLAKLSAFDDEIARRAEIARQYTEGLSDVVSCPALAEGMSSAWAQYTIRVSARDDVASALRERGVPTAIYYPVPMHRQPAYRHYPSAGCTTAETLAGEVLSLPIHPDLDDEQVDRVVEAVRRSVTGRG